MTKKIIQKVQTVTKKVTKKKVEPVIDVVICTACEGKGLKDAETLCTDCAGSGSK